MRQGFRIQGVIAVAVGASCLAVAAGFADSGSSAAPRQPNIIFVLTDDLSWNLVKYMPHVKQMQKQGVTFGRYFVTDSLCCPSRASIFTGKLPHDTGVFTNSGKDGGFKLFHSLGHENSTFATRLQSAGYLTAMMGKYMNGYVPTAAVDDQIAYVPPGWDEWDVAGNAYSEYNYILNENGQLLHYGRQPADYLTDVLAAKGSAFIDQAAVEDKPFLLEIATFAPHSPYTPAPRHLGDFPGLRAPRTPAFDEADIRDKPAWLRTHLSLREVQIANIDSGFRRRAQAVESVDELIGRLQVKLKAENELSNTYIFFSSDNGFHMGEHRLSSGKQTAFETDIRVPLVVTGPGVPRGRTVNKLASNIDLYPTFVRLAGEPVPPAVDGRSLLPLLGPTPVASWRKAVLVEHHGPDRDRSDPDFPPPGSGNPDTYAAIRTTNGTYVEYVDGELEYYNLKRDPFELNNSVGLLTQNAQSQLHSRLTALVDCHGGAACRKADSS
jgi:arylsulfatase A-like enzyme